MAAPTLGRFEAPVGSFRRHCNVCKQPYIHLHPFYHQLCVRCGDFNLEKRLQTAQLEGCMCLVTGGRVRIGYQICLKLLRAGATVIATYSHEHDFNVWRHRLNPKRWSSTTAKGIDGRKKLGIVVFPPILTLLYILCMYMAGCCGNYIAAAIRCSSRCRK